MMKNIDSANSALYHIETIERKLKMLRQTINPETGTLNDSRLMAQLMVTAEDEMKNLREDLVRLM